MRCTFTFTPCPLRKKGLTLIELLIVIGIIATLAGIMFLLGIEAKHRIYEIKCLSQMRQLHSAILLYLQDNDDTFPADLGDEIFPYVKDFSFFFCPIWYALYSDGKTFEQLYKEAEPWDRSTYGYVPHIINQLYRIYREEGPDPEKSRHITAPFEYYYSQRGDDIPIVYCWRHERHFLEYRVLLVRMNGQAQVLIMPIAKSEKEAKYPHEW